MVKVQFMSDLIEENGNSVKQNNMELKHKIAINSLVEVNCECSNSHGLRLFVSAHTRDCDGTPLYSLSLEKTQETIREREKDNVLNAYLKGLDDGCRIHGFDEDSLVLIKS